MRNGAVRIIQVFVLVILYLILTCCISTAEQQILFKTEKYDASGGPITVSECEEACRNISWDIEGLLRKGAEIVTVMQRVTIEVENTVMYENCIRSYGDPKACTNIKPEICRCFGDKYIVNKKK